MKIKDGFSSGFVAVWYTFDEFQRIKQRTLTHYKGIFNILNIK